MKTIEIFTDGVCWGNSGLGGWSAILRSDKTVQSISGHREETTKNRMELLACIEALKQLKEKSRVLLTTSSKYVFNGATEYLSEWYENNWKHSNGNLISNADLWIELDLLTDIYDVEWELIEKYQDIPECEACHLTALEEIENNSKKYRKYFS